MDVSLPEAEEAFIAYILLKDETTGDHVKGRAVEVDCSTPAIYWATAPTLWCREIATNENDVCVTWSSQLECWVIV